MAVRYFERVAVSDKSSKSSVLLECVKCGQKYQAIAPEVCTCLCGGELKPAEKQHQPVGKP